MAPEGGPNFQTVGFPLLGGIETKVSDISLQPPKLTTAENCFAERTGAIRRRKGISTLSTKTVDNDTIFSGGASAAAAVARYKQSLVALDGPANSAAVYQYSTTASRWTEHGTYAPGVLTSEQISAASGGGGIWQTDLACTGGYVLYAFIEDGLDDSGTFHSTVRVTLQDSVGAFVCHRLQVFTDSGVGSIAEKMNLRVVALGTQFYVFFGDGTNRDVRVWLLDVATPATITSAIGTSGAGSSASSVLVASDLHTTATELAIFDAEPSGGNGVFFGYRTSTANRITIGFVNAAGALVNTTNVATVADATGLRLAVQSSSRHGIGYSAGGNFYGIHMSWSGAAWSTTATSGATAGAIAACRYDSATTLRLWYASGTSVIQATFTTAGVLTTGLNRLRLAAMQSRVFVAQDARLYFWAIVGYGTNQPTHFLVDSATGLPVTMVNVGIAEQGLQSSVVVGPDNGYVASLLYITRAVDGAIGFASGAVNIGVRSATWYVEYAQSHKLLEAADSLYMAGGLLQQFDGVNFVEASFLRYVDRDEYTRTPSNVGGSMTASGQYYYRIVPEWTNARGKREQGTDNGPGNVTLGAGDNRVTLVIPSIVMTRRRRTNTVTSSAQTARNNLVFAVYRTTANPATEKAPFHRVGEVTNDPTADTVSFVDTMSDATCALNEELYLTAGELDHTPPPQGHIMCEGMGRLFIAGEPEHPLTVFYSLLRQQDDPVAFSDALTIVLPDHGGAIVALAVIAEVLVVFRERAIYRVRGSGLDNTGQTGGFLDPELVANDIGCTGQRSVVVTPFGVMFHSARGFQLLDPGASQVEYIGAPLEGLIGSDNPSSGAIKGAILLPLEQQVRFYDARMWVYDYWHKQWFMYTDAGIPGGPSVEWEDAHAWGAGASVQYEDDGQMFTAGNMRVVMSLLRSGTAVQENLRVRGVGVSGRIDTGTSANLRIKLYSNLAAAVVQTETETAIPAGPVFVQRRTKNGARVVSALRMEVDDNGTAADGILSLNEVFFEVATRAAGPTRRLGR